VKVRIIRVHERKFNGISQEVAEQAWKSCGTWILSFVGPQGGIVKATGLGDGAKHGEFVIAMRSGEGPVTKLTLDAASRRPGYSGGHRRPARLKDPCPPHALQGPD